MPYTSTFQNLVSRGAVEQAVLSLIQTPPAGSTYPLIVYYLAEVERQLGLAAQTILVPPGSASYRGGVDFDTFEQEWQPVITVAAQPTGEAERYDSDGKYGQWYEIQVAATVTAGDEDSARVLADQYGAALAGLLLQQGGLGTRTDSDGSTITFAEKTVLRVAPRVEYPNPKLRRLLRSIVLVESFVQGVFAEAGPGSFGTNPYTAPGALPNVSTVKFELQTEDTLGNVGPASGATVTDDDADVVVTE